MDSQVAISREREISQIGSIFSHFPQVEAPVNHMFSPGVYMREITMAAGSFIIGKKHKTKHFNIILSGKARVMSGGDVFEVEAPYVFVSDAGVQKVLHILEEMKWITVHPSDETDIKTLEDALVEEPVVDISFLDPELREMLNSLKQLN